MEVVISTKNSYTPRSVGLSLSYQARIAGCDQFSYAASGDRMPRPVPLFVAKPNRRAFADVYKMVKSSGRASDSFQNQRLAGVVVPSQSKCSPELRHALWRISVHLGSEKAQHLPAFALKLVGLPRVMDALT